MDTSQMTVIKEHVEDIAADLDVWVDSEGPDARARRYASAALDAIDATISELHAIRARLMTEVRAADDAVLAAPVPASLQGYGYTLPEDYLRGGGQ